MTATAIPMATGFVCVGSINGQPIFSLAPQSLPPISVVASVAPNATVLVGLSQTAPNSTGGGVYFVSNNGTITPLCI